jgi:hypothetical protein
MPGGMENSLYNTNMIAGVAVARDTKIPRQNILSVRKAL